MRTRPAQTMVSRLIWLEIMFHVQNGGRDSKSRRVFLKKKLENYIFKMYLNAIGNWNPFEP